MELELITKNNTGELHLSPIKINEDYRTEWNIHSEDFVCLTKNGELISESLYRKGGLGGFKPDKKYSLILKYVEDYYSKKTLKMSGSKDPKHLSGRWCIIDNEGVEKVVFNNHESPYLKGGCVYSLKNDYYNIETNELYCKSVYNTVESGEFLFIENNYDDDKSRRGVWKINKEDGTYEIFPKK